MQYLLNEDEYKTLDSYASKGRYAEANITIIKRDFVCRRDTNGGYCEDCIFASTTNHTQGLCMLGYVKRHSK